MSNSSDKNSGDDVDSVMEEIYSPGLDPDSDISWHSTEFDGESYDSE